MINEDHFTTKHDCDWFENNNTFAYELVLGFKVMNLYLPYFPLK